MNIEKMKEDAIFDFQPQMIDAYAEMIEESAGFAPDNAEAFDSFCTAWKMENNCAHVDTPKYY